MDSIAGSTFLSWIDESVSGDGLSAALDVTDFDGPVAFHVTAKNIAGTSPTLDVTLHHATTSGGTYAAVTGGTFTQMTTPDGVADGQTIILDVAQLRGFVKFDLNVGGTAPDYAIACAVVGRKKYTS